MASPFSSSRTVNTYIEITFKPKDSKKVTSCDQIVDIQFVKLLGDGAPILPSTLWHMFAYRDVVTTDEFWCIDFVNGETTPDYQQGGYQVGFKTDLRGERDAILLDQPNFSFGGDKGWKSHSNPGGWTKLEATFRTFCWCMKGEQCGSWYEGLSWNYVMTAQDYINGSKGTSTIVDDRLQDLPAELLAAFDKFNKHFKFVPCGKTLGGEA